MRWTWTAALALWAGIATAAEPKVTQTQIDSFPARMFYFKNSDVIILHNIDKQTLHRSEDDGEKWVAITAIPDGELFDIYDHPFDSNRAYAFTLSKTHYMTEDKGKTWKKFTTPAVPHVRSELLSFHAKEPDWILYNGDDCDLGPEYQCHPKTYYTKNNFKNIDFMDEYVSSCQYAQSTELFETSHKERVFCAKNRELYQSDDYFKKDRSEAPLASGRGIKGLIGLATVKKFIVAATKAPGTDEMALYVTHDAVTWAKAQFPKDHSLREGSYTVLESTNYSIQIDVLSGNSGNSMGVLFTSNSNGTYFTRSLEHTNHNNRGIIDFEKMSNIQGIVFVNEIKNWKDFEGGVTMEKKVQSVISFTDGRHWQDLVLKSGQRLHLHSVTDQRQGGKVFSSPAPGLVMGVGNTGESLMPFNEGDLFVSDDAGLSWKLAMKGPHLYEFGDQGSILVAVRMDGGETGHFGYSLDHGATWKEGKLPLAIRPRLLTIRPDSTSQRFVLVGSAGTGEDQKNYIFSLNFEGILPDCKESDYEEWIARHSTKVETDCVMGHRQKYKRRKQDAQCLVPERLQAALPEPEPCECTIIDYECDFNFVRDGDECVQEGPIAIPENQCKKPTDTYQGTSGWRKIPGNDCRGGFDGKAAPDALVERPCIEAGTTPNGAITHKITEFGQQPIDENYYLERMESSTGKDETIVMRTRDQHVWITYDHGKEWQEILKDEGVVAIYPHDYYKDAVYFVTASKKLWYSVDRAKKDTIHSLDVPAPPNVKGIPVLAFHPKEKNWLIWTSQEGCPRVNDPGCHSNTWYTQHNGREWHELLAYTRKCEFVWREERADSPESMIYCEKYEKETSAAGNPLRLIESQNWFTDSDAIDNPKFKSVIAFATMSEFIVVAARNPDGDDLRLDSSVDANRFAHAQFPANFKVVHQQAYTVLDSSTHAVFIHVTLSDLKDREYGTILKSNSNGTYYVKSLEFANRNYDGYVDYEKMLGIEGVALGNVVSNVAEVDEGRPKKIKSKITHNDGSDWALIPAPTNDTQKLNGCDPKDIEKCSLHLHGYTERPDPRQTYSSAAAIGIMLGVGNVGESLGTYENAHTFITRDAGVTWNYVAKGQHMWEYGDRGSIIVIVKRFEEVNHVQYSIDEGLNWQTYKFDDKKYQILSITTVPSDTSRQFLLWAKRSGTYVTINLDFTQLTSRPCKLDEEDPEGGDYYLWTPEHPIIKDACLFGHIAKYHRKKVDRDCFNGPNLVALHEDKTACECTNHDYECDFNYERVQNYQCALVDGLNKLDHVELCKSNPDLVEYYPATGYRRIPLDTCKGGLELDKVGEPLPCPGHEKQFAEKRRVSGAALFFAIVIPILAAAGFGYWVWHNFEGKFGRIRLGGDSGSFSSESPLVRYPVAFISGCIAVVAALPLLASSLWRSVATTLGIGGGYGRVYNSRGSFARNRDYAAVDDGELLGEDSDDEV